KQVRVDGLNLDIHFADVEALNEGLVRGDFPVAKASFAAAAAVASTHVTLPCGGAVGFGVGPVLLAPAEPDANQAKRQRVLLPGENTTATLLWRTFHADIGAEELHVRFDRIMPMLQTGVADYGVCIHEGRFTWEQHGLTLLEDLGARYEVRFKQPLPLGGVFARADLGKDVHAALTRAIRASLQVAKNDPAAALVTQRLHAQELQDSVLQRHVECYVNQYTEKLDGAGLAALGTLESLLQHALPPIADV
ncbi:MAG: hypothetical protein EXS14_09805, partial [Planctomycetes bacterium]|nr:hypothetical protein [Planctomycetota bacterium]